MSLDEQREARRAKNEALRSDLEVYGGYRPGEISSQMLIDAEEEPIASLWKAENRSREAFWPMLRVKDDVAQSFSHLISLLDPPRRSNDREVFDRRLSFILGALVQSAWTRSWVALVNIDPERRKRRDDKFNLAFRTLEKKEVVSLAKPLKMDNAARKGSFQISDSHLAARLRRMRPSDVELVGPSFTSMNVGHQKKREKLRSFDSAWKQMPKGKLGKKKREGKRVWEGREKEMKAYALDALRSQISVRSSEIPAFLGALSKKSEDPKATEYRSELQERISKLTKQAPEKEKELNLSNLFVESLASVFTDDLWSHGRVYSFVTMIPKEARTFLRLGGAETIEVDLSGLHSRIFAARHGHDWVFEQGMDIYEEFASGFGLDVKSARSLMKAPVNSLWNCKSEEQACRLIGRELLLAGSGKVRRQAGVLLERGKPTMLSFENEEGDVRSLADLDPFSEHVNEWKYIQATEEKIEEFEANVRSVSRRLFVRGDGRFGKGVREAIEICGQLGWQAIQEKPRFKAMVENLSKREGQEMTYIESTALLQTLGRLRGEGIFALPIHDGLRVKRKHAERAGRIFSEEVAHLVSRDRKDFPFKVD